MSSDFHNPFTDPHNPYASPYARAMEPNRRQLPKGKVMAPAIFLIVVGTLGFMASLFNVLSAVFVDPAPVDPDLPEFFRAMEEAQTGPVAAITQGIFVAVNLLILLGAVLMLQFRMWGLALASSILAMINFGSCCCILGVPAGIWSLIVLCQNDVRSAFLFMSK